MLKSFRIGIANLLDPTRASVRERRATRAMLAVAETEDTISKNATSWSAQYSTRANWDRSKILTQVINAYRSNPIARRIIEITTEFVIGDGFSVSTKEKASQAALSEDWNDPINDFGTQIIEWATEAWMTGDLFLIASVNRETGRTYWRACPSENIGNIETKLNDYRQEVYFEKVQTDDAGDRYFAYDPGGEQIEFMRHYPLNRLVGSTYGESDLGSVLYWILLYKQYLEDRARLNHFRQLFTFVVQKDFSGSATEKAKYVDDFMAKMPKKSGGILAMDNDETIGTINPNLGSFEAEQDGLQIKRMIVTGVGMVMHWFAEPEGSTRTTAEAAGTPSFRRFKMRQKYLINVIADVLKISYDIRRQVKQGLPEDPKIEINAPDITERDNANLAIAVQRVVQAFSPLYNAKKISAKELMRIAYRFMAEKPPEENPTGFADTEIPMGSSGGKGLPPAPDQSAST